MKRWLLLLTLILSFASITFAAAQDDETDCSPDLTAVSDLLDAARTALDEGDTDAALDLMTEANDLLASQLENCRPSDDGADIVFNDPDLIDDYALTLDDLPEDWLEALIEDDGSLAFLCSELPESDSVRIRRQFLASNVGPAVLAGMTIFEDHADAEAGFDAIVEVINSCGTWTLTSESGESVDYKANILSEGDYGEDSITIRIVYNNVEGNLIYILQNNTVISMGQLVLDPSETIDLELLESLIDLAIERLNS